MGVLTLAYSISPKMVRKIRNDNENLAYILGDCENESQMWQVDSYDFDKGIEIYISILRASGCKKTARNIDCESQDLDVFDYNGYDLWVITPSGIKTMIKELENSTFEKMKKNSIVAEVSDRRGYPLNESLLESYIDDFKSIKKFFQQTVERGNYLLFSEA